MFGLRCILLLMAAVLSAVVALPPGLKPSSRESIEVMLNKQLDELKKTLQIFNKKESNLAKEMREIMFKADTKQDISLETKYGEMVRSEEEEHSSTEDEEQQQRESLESDKSDYETKLLQHSNSAPDEYVSDERLRLKRQPIEDPEPIDHSKCAHSQAERPHDDELAHEHLRHKLEPETVLRSVRAAASSSSEEHGENQNQSSSEEEPKQAAPAVTVQPTTESQAARRRRHAKDNLDQLTSIEDYKKDSDKSSNDESSHENHRKMGPDDTEFDDYALGCEVKEVDSKEANDTFYKE